MSSRPSTSGKRGGSSKNIDIFLRCRPVPRQSENFTYDLQDGSTSIEIPHEASSGYINNKRENYDFKFNGIFGPEAKQDEVFDGVAKKVVLGALQGVNGTIFAYGQTGSGKTFTITGGAERYVDRGIIPRSISLIYQELEKRTDQQVSVSISYLEIYQGRGYDLLDPDREVKQIEDLPKVSLWEDGDGKFVPRNLSAHNAISEEDALNLLFLGDTNRTISETPMNLTSSRSHCIFIVNMEVRTPGEDTVRRSKLNLVDLAGSERVAKTNIDGTILAEAQYINGSLHFLEQVIIALQEKASGINRHHIPYRNSMMTAILKDSLGGNCCTAMVATVNMSEAQLGECISTCRFAQRVAMISNVVMVNEELDPKLMIKRLKQEIRDLKEEIGILRGGGGGEDEQEVNPGSQMFNHIKQQIQQYISDASSNAKLNVGGSMSYIRTAFQIFKGFVSNPSPKNGGGLVEEGGKSASSADVKGLEEQCKKYKLQIQQRDNEISILVSMMKKRSDMGGLQAIPQPALLGASATEPTSSPGAATGTRLKSPGGGKENMQSSNPGGDDMDVLANTNLLANRNKAFELFRKSYRKSEAIEENKILLKEKFQEAKSLGRIVSESKQKISSLKSAIEKRRMERAVQGLSQADGGGEDVLEDPQEEMLKSQIDGQKMKYKEGFGKLRSLKREIEHIQKILENSRKKLQSDFEHWLSVMVRQQQGQIRSPMKKQDRPNAVRQAWGDNSPSRKFASKQGGGGSAAKALDFDFEVDPAVMQKAKPLLTGNAEADRDIIKFYQARHRLVNQP